MLDEFLKANLGLWNEWTEIHETSAFYDLEGFRAGKSSLHSIELDELGDVAGKRLLHLQCHFGLDTLSWARLGATVTGVDFSERAIALARSLAAELALPATFVQSTVDELQSNLTRRLRHRLHLVRRHRVARRPAALGAAPSPTFWRRAAPSTWSSCTRWPARSTTSTRTPSCASWGPTFRRAGRGACASTARTPTPTRTSSTTWPTAGPTASPRS